MLAAWAAVLAAVVVTMGTTAAWSLRIGRAAVVDVAWGACFAVAALAAAAAAGTQAATDASVPRRWLLAALVTAWGSRLALHLWQRVRATNHDDPRYEDLLGGTVRSVPASRLVTKVFLLQGALVVLICAPVVVGVTRPVSSWWVVLAGVLLWALGMIFESVGDAQLRAYRAASGGRSVLDAGLWAWTRHPNYFGDACVWWGLWLIGGAATGPGPAVATVAAPALMTWFLTAVSGVRLAERRMAGRPGWAAYVARTSAFIPRPPRRQANPAREPVPNKEQHRHNKI